jgi:hypothetical protein
MLRLVALFPALLVALPLLAADKEKAATDAPGEDPKVRSGYLQAEYMEGRLTQVDGEGDEKTFTLEIVKKVQRTNAKAQEKLAELNKAYQKHIYDTKGKPNADFLKKTANDVAETKKQLIEVVDVPYEFVLRGDKELIVRRQVLPPKEGEDGKVGKYTKEELDKLKGDNPKLPGYIAESKDLDKDIPVRVWLDRAKMKAAAAEKKGKEDAGTPSYPVSMLMILPLKDTKDPKDTKGKDKK